MFRVQPSLKIPSPLMGEGWGGSVDDTTLPLTPSPQGREEVRRWTHWLQWGSLFAIGIITAKVAPRFLSAVQARFPKGTLNRGVRFMEQDFLASFSIRGNVVVLTEASSRHRLSTMVGKEVGGGVRHFHGRLDSLVLEELDGPIVLRIRGATTNEMFETTFTPETDAYRFLVDNRHLWRDIRGADAASPMLVVGQMNYLHSSAAAAIGRAQLPVPPLRGVFGHPIVYAHTWHKPGGENALFIYEITPAGKCIGTGLEAVAAYVSRADPDWQKLSLGMITDFTHSHHAGSVLVRSTCRAGKLLDRFRYEGRLRPTELPEVEILQGEELLSVLRAQRFRGVQDLTSEQEQHFFATLERKMTVQLDAVAEERSMQNRTTTDIIREIIFNRGGFDWSGVKL